MSPKSQPSTPFHMTTRRRGRSPTTPSILPPTPTTARNNAPAATPLISPSTPQNIQATNAPASTPSVSPLTPQQAPTTNPPASSPDTPVKTSSSIPSTRSKRRSPTDKSSPPKQESRRQAAIAKNPALKSKYERMATLKAQFSGIAKHITPALNDLANRTEQRLSKNHSDEPVLKQLTKDLEKNLGRKKARLLLEKNLKMEQFTREHNHKVGAIESAHRREVEQIRTEMLAHAKLDFMTTIHDQEASPEEKRRVGPNLGQGPTNDREARKAPEDGRHTAYFIETQRRQNEDFYIITDKMWEHWNARLDALGPNATPEEMQAVVPLSWRRINGLDDDEAEDARPDDSLATKQAEQSKKIDGVQTEKSIEQEQKQETRSAAQPQLAGGSERYVRGIRQTKASKQGDGFVAKGVRELRVKEERLRSIREQKGRKGAEGAGVKKAKSGRKGKGRR